MDVPMGVAVGDGDVRPAVAVHVTQPRDAIAALDRGAAAELDVGLA
jgi:hypothetical protein